MQGVEAIHPEEEGKPSVATAWKGGGSYSTYGSYSDYLLIVLFMSCRVGLPDIRRRYGTLQLSYRFNVVSTVSTGCGSIYEASYCCARHFQASYEYSPLRYCS